jgi:hypothetical protein
VGSPALFIRLHYCLSVTDAEKEIFHAFINRLNYFVCLPILQQGGGRCERRCRLAPSLEYDP